MRPDVAPSVLLLDLSLPELPSARRPSIGEAARQWSAVRGRL